MTSPDSHRTPMPNPGSELVPEISPGVLSRSFLFLADEPKGDTSSVCTETQRQTKFDY